MEATELSRRDTSPDSDELDLRDAFGSRSELVLRGGFTPGSKLGSEPKLDLRPSFFLLQGERLVGG